MVVAARMGNLVPGMPALRTSDKSTVYRSKVPRRMPFVIFRSHVSIAAAVVVASFAGCVVTEAPMAQKQFSDHVAMLLAGRDSAVVEAGKLTDFQWTTLCFERDDSLVLRFDQGRKKSVLQLPYEAFFVDEGQVEHSLEGGCVTPSEHILLKKKYPGDHGPIEFQKAAHGG
ncbi:hypothetical protein [Xanthomonas campestris]|uniref:hypothetical protein n=1 Tax=Xanthomonas campestris TaxID=339 RepID=UPI002B225E4A|nr:hypothetical protein [Xanthomonas campestris]MEA9726500.1 hypothetical protein [Xanthomonas campestris pv. raphani]